MLGDVMQLLELPEAVLHEVWTGVFLHWSSTEEMLKFLLRNFSRPLSAHLTRFTEESKSLDKFLTFIKSLMTTALSSEWDYKDPLCK